MQIKRGISLDPILGLPRDYVVQYFVSVYGEAHEGIGKRLFIIGRPHAHPGSRADPPVVGYQAVHLVRILVPGPVIRILVGSVAEPFRHLFADLCDKCWIQHAGFFIPRDSPYQVLMIGAFEGEGETIAARLLLLSAFFPVYREPRAPRARLVRIQY